MLSAIVLTVLFSDDATQNPKTKEELLSILNWISRRCAQPVKMERINNKESKIESEMFNVLNCMQFRNDSIFQVDQAGMT